MSPAPSSVARDVDAGWRNAHNLSAPKVEVIVADASEQIRRFRWAIDARARSQTLLLALYQVSLQGPTEGRKTELFSLLVGVAFSLWRAAFLTIEPTRDWKGALSDAEKLLSALLKTNTLAPLTEMNLQGWTGGYYLNNAKLRLAEASRRLAEQLEESPADVAKIAGISLLGTDPLETWTLFCDEAERLASRHLGCVVHGTDGSTSVDASEK
jgi:hypothetical protein